MKNLIAFTFLTLLFISCNKDEDPFLFPNIPDNSEEHIVFGNYYGFCAGEDCINIYKITNSALYANTNSVYPGNTNFFPGVYQQLPHEKFKAVVSMLNATPVHLLSIEDTIIGCPDCSDGGGVYFEYKVDGFHKFWLIDQFKENIPAELHSLVDAVNESVATIKQ